MSTPTTDAEKAALVWLEGCMRLSHGGERHADVIRAMLARSMPEEPTDAAITAMDRAFLGDLGSRPSLWRGVYRALREELGKPAFRIITSHVRPPVPSRAYDWCAYFDGEEERGGYGWGSTETEAIRDMFNIHEEPAKVSAIAAALVVRNAA